MSIQNLLIIETQPTQEEAEYLVLKAVKNELDTNIEIKRCDVKEGLICFSLLIDNVFDLRISSDLKDLQIYKDPWEKRVTLNAKILF